MKLENDFKLNTRNLYLYCYSCFDCQRSDQGLELHHITGRDSNSPFNAIPICMKCHKVVGHSQEEERKFFKLNLDFLVRERYRPTKKDWQFLRDHPHLVDRPPKNAIPSEG